MKRTQVLIASLACALPVIRASGLQCVLGEQHRRGGTGCRVTAETGVPSSTQPGSSVY